MPPEQQGIITTPDFVRAAILRSLGARLIRIESDPKRADRKTVVLDVTSVRGGAAARAAEFARELGAAVNAATDIDAINGILDNTALASVSGHFSDLKRRSAA
jgi:hypothetical protein